jgi:hypothetical protein
VRELHDAARDAFVVWRENHSPKHGPIFTLMTRCRAQFKYALRSCRIEEERLRAEAFAKSLDSGDNDKCWSDMRKQSIKSNVLSSTVEHART